MLLTSLAPIISASTVMLPSVFSATPTKVAHSAAMVTPCQILPMEPSASNAAISTVTVALLLMSAPAASLVSPSLLQHHQPMPLAYSVTSQAAAHAINPTSAQSAPTAL